MLITKDMDTIELLGLMQPGIPLAAAENLRDALLAAGYENKNINQVTSWADFCDDAISHAQDRLTAEIWDECYFPPSRTYHRALAQST